jgi:hypothetical protein
MVTEKAAWAASVGIGSGNPLPSWAVTLFFLGIIVVGVVITIRRRNR